jgi:hypothetical protein
LKKFFSRKGKVAGLLLSAVLLVAGLLVPAATAAAQASVNVWVDPANQSVEVCDTVTVYVMIDSDTNPVAGDQFSLAWDPAILECTGISYAHSNYFLEAWVDANPSASMMYYPMDPNSTIDNTAGTITAASAAIMNSGGNGPEGSGILFNVEFHAKANGHTTLDLSGVVVSDPAMGIYNVVEGDANVYVGQPVPAPDLEVTAKAESWVDQGTKQYQIDYTVTNTGTEPTVQSNTSIAVDGTVITVEACPALNPGESYATTCLVTPIMTGSSDDILITADVYNQVTEGNENNNERLNTFSFISDSDGTIIDAGLGALLELDPPDDVLQWTLQLGDNEVSGTLNVKSNTSWECKVSDQDGTTVGHMTDWNGATYGTAQLGNAHVVECDAEATSVTLPTEGKICDGVVADQNGNDGEDFTIDFNQVVEYADPLLPSGHTYHIVVTFTAAVTI